MASSASASVSAAAAASASIPSAGEAEADAVSLLNNPLLKEDSPFPCFDAVEAKHVVPGIRAILKHLVSSTPFSAT
jgi:oligopeptidase A